MHEYMENVWPLACKRQLTASPIEVLGATNGGHLQRKSFRPVQYICLQHEMSCMYFLVKCSVNLSDTIV